jgi:hypothetical protein
MKSETLTDVELAEALKLAADRARMAAADELRKVTDTIAGLGLEASARLAKLAGDRALAALRRKISRLEDAAFHYQTCSVCRREGDDACNSGRWFAGYLRGDHDEDGAPTTPAAGQGPIMGKVRNVTIHPDGRLTADLEMTDAGGKFLEKIRNADPALGSDPKGGS